MATYFPIEPGPQSSNRIAPTGREQVGRLGLDYDRLIADLPSSRRRTWRRQVEARLANLEARDAALEAAEETRA